MEFFKKLFGYSTAQSSNDIKSNNKEDHEHQVTIPQFAHNNNLTSWENFFGVNLKSSPNELWIEGECEYNEKNQNFHKQPYPQRLLLFSKCKSDRKLRYKFLLQVSLYMG